MGRMCWFAPEPNAEGAMPNAAIKQGMGENHRKTTRNSGKILDISDFITFRKSGIYWDLSFVPKL